MKIVESCIDSLKENELRALENNIEICKKMLNENNPPYTEVQNFHLLLASFSKNQFFNFFLNAIVDINNTFIKQKVPGLPLSAEHIDQHKKILEALKKKNMKAAKKALILHTTSVGTHLQKHYEKSKR